MERSGNPQSIERLRGENLAAAFERFVTNHTAEDNTGPRLRGERSGEFHVILPSGILEDLTLEPIDSLRIESELLGQDSDSSEIVYDIRFRNEGKNVFTISHITGHEFTIHNANDDCINEQADERTVATMLALITDLENMSNVVPISLGGIPAEHSQISVNGALPSAAAGELGNSVVHGAGVITAENPRDADPAEPEKSLSGFALGKEFKSFVSKHTEPYDIPNPENIIAVGICNVEYPPDVPPYISETPIDSVKFEISKDVDSETGEEIGSQRSAISFLSEGELIVKLVRITEGVYCYEYGQGENDDPVAVEQERTIIAILAELESLEAAGNLAPTPITAL